MRPLRGQGHQAAPDAQSLEPVQLVSQGGGSAEPVKESQKKFVTMGSLFDVPNDPPSDSESLLEMPAQRSSDNVPIGEKAVVQQERESIHDNPDVRPSIAESRASSIGLMPQIKGEESSEEDQSSEGDLEQEDSGVPEEMKHVFSDAEVY